MLRAHRVVVIVEPIATKLEDIATHIVESKLVRHLLLHRMCRLIAVCCSPSHLVNNRAAAILIALALLTSASSILPLRLGWQNVGFTCLLAQLLAKPPEIL